MAKNVNIDNTLVKGKHGKTNTIFMVVIVLFTFLLYGNTLNNYYSLDDHLIQGQDGQLMKEGLGAIDDIFTTIYASKTSADQEARSYGYRPLVRTLFAIEYSLLKVVGFDPYKNPGAAAKMGHFVNILLYLFLALILYSLLRRFFKGYSIWFPFVIILLFIAHPVHTEVVASLKNRDELMSMIFSLLTLKMLFKYHDRNKISILIIGLIFYIMAFLSKPTALAFWFVFPLCLWFFSDMKLKKIGLITGLLTLMIILGGIVPFWFIENTRQFDFIENPLHYAENIWYIFGTGLISLGYYLKLLIIPHPLLYYYGYDMIPIVNLGNIWVILSFIIYTGMLAFAIWKFREKNILSFAILFYLLTIAMFSNIIRPAPGIIAERFLLAPSLGFVIVLAWVIFKLFKAEPASVSNKNARIFFVMFTSVIILGAYSYKTFTRNQNWYNQATLFAVDMPYLENSVKAHDMMGSKTMRLVELELAKQVNVTKFIMPEIEKALHHFERAVEIYPGHQSSWKNMGMIYNHPRIAEHFAASGDSARYMHFKKKAISSFRRSLELDPGDGKALFNLGLTYEALGRYDSAVFYFEECIADNPKIIYPRSRLADLKFRFGDYSGAIELNKEIIRIDPMEALPYVSFGNYYMVRGDTLLAVESYEEAAKRNARPEVFAFLAQYYLDSGNMEKAQFYREKYMNAIEPE